MKKLTIQLNQTYKSFENGFHTTLEGDLTILSGVNGAGKSQIIDIILGHDKTTNTNINSTIKIDDIEIKREDIDYRSFKENIGILELTGSTSQAFLASANAVWDYYKRGLLIQILNANLGQHTDSCLEAKNILLKSFSQQEFDNLEINETEFKEKLRIAGFVLRAGDKFTNAVGEIFFAHAVRVNDEMVEVSRAKFNSSKSEGVTRTT